MHTVQHLIQRLGMKHIWTDQPTRPYEQPRQADRRTVTLPARLTWKDQRGMTRFASVVTRNVSDFGVYVECISSVSIPLYRLVQFQIEHQAADSEHLPFSLRNGRVLSAVYRISPATPSGGRQGLALRLMVDPKRYRPEIVADRATA